MATNRDRVNKLQEQIADLEERIGNLQRLTEVTDNRFQAIQTRRDEARNLKNEVENIKQQTEILFSEIQKKKTSAFEFESSIKDLVDEAEESQETFEKHSKNLQEIEAKIQKFEKEITIQLGRASSGALARAFSNRQEEVEKELKKWHNYLLISTGSLVVAGIGFFIYSLLVKIDWQFFLKLSVVFPIIYAEWFASRQYTKERFIVERYAFKAAQAKSLSAFSKTVKEMDESEAGRIEAQKFVISSVAKIYIAPKLNDEDEGSLIIDKALKMAKDIVKINKL